MRKQAQAFSAYTYTSCSEKTPVNALVTLLDPPFSDLTYSVPSGLPETLLKPGQRVAVPLGRSPVRAALLRKLTTDTPEGIKLRDLIWPLEDSPVLPRPLLDMLDDLALRQCAPTGAAISLVLPFLKETRVTLQLMDRGEKNSYTLQALAKAEPELRARLAELLVSGRAHMVSPRKDAAKTERCVLTCSAPWPVRPHALRQIQCLEYLAVHGATNRRTLIRVLGGKGKEIVDSLGTLGLLRIESDDGLEEAEAINEALLPPQDKAFELNVDQKMAVADITAALRSGKTAQRLLYGVTGSGKTAVYLEAARDALSHGRSVLLLAPEVAIAHKLRRDAAAALAGAEIIFYHGYQSQTRREDVFRRLAVRKTPCLVVGTRSALFLPLPSLGIIFIDEEHDASFKQEDHVPYQAKEIAWFRAARENAVLVLGSATPDLKTWYAAQHNLLPVLSLPHRVHDQALPDVQLVDIGKKKSLGQAQEQCVLAPQSLSALDETLKKGEQAIILLNRRGYAPSVFCPDCSTVLTCPNCSVGLSYHRDLGRLMCHYCGYSIPFPAPCPKCHNMNFLPVGEGTEKLTEFLEERYQCSVLRLDRDSTRRAGAMEEILNSFAHHEAPIMVGTQMLSKGHHFPDVTLAVVADGDLSLSLPDYRAAENTFQLLVQSSGRAGRGEKPGRVFIQTRDTTHYCWQYIRTADYEGFYQEEIQRRERFGYPPFVRLALIRFTFPRSSAAGKEAFNAISVFLHEESARRGIRIMGPVACPIPVIGNRSRYHCLIKAESWKEARNLYYIIMNRPEAAKLRIQLDLDPITMM